MNWKKLVEQWKAWWRKKQPAPQPQPAPDPVPTPTPDPVTPPAPPVPPPQFPTWRKTAKVRLSKSTHNFSALFPTAAGVRACAYENLHEQGRDDSYILDPMAGRRIYTETCETFGEPVLSESGLHYIPQEGGERRMNVFAPASGSVQQGITQTHKIALCGVTLNGVPHVFSWNQKQGRDSRTVMQNAISGAVVYDFRGVVGCPVSAVEVSPGVALCAFNFGDDVCVTTDGRRVSGTYRVNALAAWRRTRNIYGGDRDGNILRLNGMAWEPVTNCGGRVFRFAPGETQLYATVDSPPRLVAIAPDGQWREVDRGPIQKYGQFGLNVALQSPILYWTRQDESRTGECVRLEIV
jgi:hypothetical protein